jgi:hypothetical protein
LKIFLFESVRMRRAFHLTIPSKRLARYMKHRGRDTHGAAQLIARHRELEYNERRTVVLKALLVWVLLTAAGWIYITPEWLPLFSVRPSFSLVLYNFKSLDLTRVSSSSILLVSAFTLRLPRARHDGLGQSVSVVLSSSSHCGLQVRLTICCVSLLNRLEIDPFFTVPEPWIATASHSIGYLTLFFFIGLAFACRAASNTIVRGTVIIVCSWSRS